MGALLALGMGKGKGKGRKKVKGGKPVGKMGTKAKFSSKKR
jgi:hypothetical protein